jgi:hypothetical protein
MHATFRQKQLDTITKQHEFVAVSSCLITKTPCVIEQNSKKQRKHGEK